MIIFSEKENSKVFSLQISILRFTKYACVLEMKMLIGPIFQHNYLLNMVIFFIINTEKFHSNFLLRFCFNHFSEFYVKIFK